jgi:hypothetical protein
VLTASFGSSTVTTSNLQLPGRMLWAWERPEDLRGLDPARTGVAFLDRTVSIGPNGVTTRPRLQPLAVAPGTALVAVVRIETTREAARLTEAVRADVAASIEAAARPDVRGVQIDFDARESEREFYRALLHDVRARLPSGTALTMTALASWCMADDWIADLPVDEAVPMLFRMGADGPGVRAHLDRGGDFPVRACRQSLGLSTDEPIGLVPRGRRLYLFHPSRWTSEAIARAIQEIPR